MVLCVVSCPLALTRLVTGVWWCQRRNGEVRDRVRGWREPLSTFEGGKERSRCEGAHGRKGGKRKKGSNGGENTSNSKDDV